MAVSERHRFLLAAAEATGAGDYFHWQRVGDALGWTDTDARQAMKSLENQSLVIALQDGQARLLASGRTLATKLASQDSQRRR